MGIPVFSCFQVRLEFKFKGVNVALHCKRRIITKYDNVFWLLKLAMIKSILSIFLYFWYRKLMAENFHGLDFWPRSPEKQKDNLDPLGVKILPNILLLEMWRVMVDGPRSYLFSTLLPYIIATSSGQCYLQVLLALRQHLPRNEMENDYYNYYYYRNRLV